MSRSGAATTYPQLEGEDLAEVVDLVQALKDRGVDVPRRPAVLMDSEGRRLELPEPVFEALLQVATAMSHGQGVTIVPRDARLTTQEAADFLGISRPTLVKFLEHGTIPHELRGRHRRVALSDLLEYEETSRRRRDEALTEMVRIGEDAGLYELTAGTPIRTR